MKRTALTRTKPLERRKPLAGTTTAKPRKPLPRESKKRKQQNREYGRVRVEYLAAHQVCEHCLSLVAAGELEPEQCKAATQIHHVHGRNGDRLCDVSGFMAVAAECHTLIHREPGRSRGMGWMGRE